MLLVYLRAVVRTMKVLAPAQMGTRYPCDRPEMACMSIRYPPDVRGSARYVLSPAGGRWASRAGLFWPRDLFYTCSKAVCALDTTSCLCYDVGGAGRGGAIGDLLLLFRFLICDLTSHQEDRIDEGWGTD